MHKRSILVARYCKLLHHARHFATCLSAIATRLGASDHLLVVGKFLAGGSTFIAAFGTTFRASDRERALPCAQRRAHFAALRAVHTAMHALSMFLFAVSYERSTVMKACIALNLAIGTNRRALHHMGGVRTLFRCVGRAHDE